MENTNKPTLQDQLDWENAGATAGYTRYMNAQEGSYNALLDKFKRKNYASTQAASTLQKAAIAPLATELLDLYVTTGNELAVARGGGSIDFVLAVSKFIEPAYFYETPAEDINLEKLNELRLKNCTRIMFIAMQKVFALVGKSRTHVASEIYSAIFHDFEAEDLAKKSPYVSVALKAVDEQAASGSLSGGSASKLDMFRKIKTRLQARDATVSSDLLKEDNATSVRIGLELLSIVVAKTGWFEVITHIKGTQRSAILQLNPEVVNKSREVAEAIAQLSPQLRPTLIPPKPWTSVFEGGFYSEKLSKVKLIKIAANDTLQDLDAQIDTETAGHMLQDVFDAINLLQNTGYAINKGVLNTIKLLTEAKVSVGQLPSAVAKYVPPKVVKGEVSDEEFIKNREQITKANRYNHSTQIAADLVNTARLVALADELADKDAFYFVHTLDFRGRAYPVCAELNPQGSDLHKALLLFKEAKEIDEDGAIWLAIHGANKYDNGLTKKTYDERYTWVIENQDTIVATAKDPLSFVPFWERAEEPFQFLAFCFEWAGWLSEGSGFQSRIPCAADGTCNALQHWSALLKDELTAKKVNLVPSDRPSDVYQAVADYTLNAVKEDIANVELAQDKREMAMFFVSRVSRSLVKQNVMTKPYGATTRGAADQLFKQLKKDAEFVALSSKQRANYLKYIAAKVQDGIAVEVRAAADGMRFVQVVAHHVCNAGVPLNWRTQDGFVVYQGYPAKTTKTIKTKLHGQGVISNFNYVQKVDSFEEDTVTDYNPIGTDVLNSKKVKGTLNKHTGGAVIETTLQIDTNKLDIRKNKLAVAPNLIHSLDATAMRVTVANAYVAGVTSMMTVHDSFATHAAYYTTLAEVTRQSFVAMHDQDYLESWMTQVTCHLNEEEMEALNEALAKEFGPTMRPAFGSLDVADVLESDYFFS